MFPVSMDCIHRLIIITKHILCEMLEDIHCLLCCYFFLRRKRYDHMIALPFTCLMKYILCLFHLLKCCIWQAVNTAHQYTFFCLIRILDIFQSILQVRCRISAFRFHDIQDLCNRHISSTSPNVFFISSRLLCSLSISL